MPFNVNAVGISGHREIPGQNQKYAQSVRAHTGMFLEKDLISNDYDYY